MSVSLTLDDVCALLKDRKPAHTSWFTRSHMSAGFEGEGAALEYFEHVASDPVAWIRSFPASLTKLNSVRKPYGALKACLYLKEVMSEYPGAEALARELAGIFGTAGQTGGVVDTILKERAQPLAAVDARAASEVEPAEGVTDGEAGLRAELAHVRALNACYLKVIRGQAAAAGQTVAVEAFLEFLDKPAYLPAEIE
jgi:hypothetical protein